jgi:hypothetical protein
MCAFPVYLFPLPCSVIASVLASSPLTINTERRDTTDVNKPMLSHFGAYFTSIYGVTYGISTRIWSGRYQTISLFNSHPISSLLIVKILHAFFN